MFRKILLYGLPAYLYMLEVFLKTLASVGADSLLGPTLAGAGIGFLLPLTEPKKIDLGGATEARLKKLNAIAFSQRDKVFVDCVWIAFLIALAAWMYALYLSFKPSENVLLISPLIIGCIIFVGSVVLTEIKERI
jgi:hypothetical protein